MKIDELKEAAEKAKSEFDKQINIFIESLDSRTDNPDKFASFTETENLFKTLDKSTRKILLDLLGESLTSIDTIEVNKSKKANSSRRE